MAEKVSKEGTIFFWYIIIALFILSLIWIYVIRPAINWISQNIIIFEIIGIIIAIIFGIVFVYYIIQNREQKKEAERIAQKKNRERIRSEEEQRIKELQEEARIRAFEDKQRALGLEKFVDITGQELWGSPDEINEWIKIDSEIREKTSLYNRVLTEINSFKSIKKYEREESYHHTLYHWFKAKFPNALYEHQIGFSRPDIVIGKIAIEVKGPTKSKDLHTIANKSMNYLQEFDSLIVVLFDLQASDDVYKNWFILMQKTFPDVKIIIK